MRPCDWIQSYGHTCGSAASASFMQVDFLHKFSGGCAAMMCQAACDRLIPGAPIPL